MDVTRPNSKRVAKAIESDLFDAYILYYNVMECGVSSEVYRLMEARQTPILAMRTFGGRDGGNFMQAKDAANPRRAALEPLYKRSGCTNRTEFCVRFPLSIPQVRTTIGSSSSVEHIRAFLEAGRTPRPLPADVTEGIKSLHRQWEPET